MLLEREAAQAALADYAREASNGSGRLVLVSGEAGTGKSALIDELRQARPAARWSWGACDGLFTPRPLGPLFDLADQLGGELAALGQAGAGRDELFRALLQQLSGPGPLHVVVIEDVHWADESTVDLLRYLGRRLRDAAVLLVVTYRDDGLTATDPLRVALGDLAAQRPTRRISLGPLSRNAVRVLAEGSGVEPSGLYELTGGNPFYVTEVLAAGMSEIPTSARDAVLARAARLPAAARTVLDVAALAGTRIELPLLTAAADCPPAVLDELLASGLLSADAGGLRFRHEIARLAVAQAVPVHRRTETHARILAALRPATGPAADDARLAFHAEAAGDTAAVLEYAPRAGRRAARLAAHREAAEQFARALRAADAAEPALRAGLHGELAWEVSLADRWDEAEQAARQALALWRTVGDRLREGDTTRLLSVAVWHLCRGAEATELAEQAIAILEPLGPTPELARACVHLAGQRMLDYEHGAVMAMARRAEQLAERFGLPDVLSDALNTQACVASNTDGGGPWAGQLERALQVARDAGQEAQAGRAYINLYSTLCAQRRFAEAEPYFTEGIAYCDDHDTPTFSIFLHSERASALEKLGRWDEAVAVAADLLRRGGPSPVIRLCPLNRLGPIRARRGEPGAWAYLDEAMAAAEGTGEAQNVVPVRLTRAEAYWLEGRLDEARREAERADSACANSDGWVRGAVAAWLRRTGSARPPRGELAGPYRAELAGDWAGAAEQWRALGCPYDAALALLGAPDEAALRSALGLLTGLGAEAVAQIARQRMRSLGVKSIPAGPRPATRADPLRLTHREREVLGLICAGHSNAEIAAQLFISVKTAGHHVSAILAKLGAPTRHAAAVKAAELGLTSEPVPR
jgi:DNA-binding CsgD family transcriptional regulator/tetratricopeptide (TPR) repeat protein